jgi:hypothetical protein
MDGEMTNSLDTYKDIEMIRPILPLKIYTVIAMDKIGSHRLEASFLMREEAEKACAWMKEKHNFTYYISENRLTEWKGK